MLRYSLIIVNVAALVMLGGCSSPGTCNASNCLGGCCNASGLCIAPTEQECGRPGQACAPCGTGQQCIVGVCMGGSAGGSGAAGGGATAGGGSATAGGFVDDAGVPRCTSTPVPCQDESIMELPGRTDINPDGVVEEGAAPDFISRIDARAGGSNP
ncbi:MAG: hypothetical protein JNK82_30290, partial [Myxococcaceae bacterium]|nr:hypothetical protein [Myxococcaceae bacterium]